MSDHTNSINTCLGWHSHKQVALACALMIVCQAIFEQDAIANAHHQGLVVAPAFANPNNDGTNSQVVNQGGSVVLQVNNNDKLDHSNGDHAGFVIRASEGYLPIGTITFRMSDEVRPTAIYTIEYDGFADFPQYPINVISDINAFAGIIFLHPSTAQVDVYIPNGLNASISNFEFIPVGGKPIPIGVDTSSGVTPGSYSSLAPPGY